MNRSESIATLAKALALFQSKIKNPANTADNPFFKSKYAPLNDILNLVRPLLSECGLTVIQSPGGDGERISVTTLLLHESGEWIESDPVVTKAEKINAQGAGSAITYLRRYSLSAILNISSEDDDDGNHVSGNKPQQQASGQRKQTTSNTPTADTPSEAQLKKIYALSKEKNIDPETMIAIMQERYGKENSKDLTKKEVTDLITFLEGGK